MPDAFTGMPTAERTEYLLDSLIEGESLDGILEALAGIAEKKARSHSNKVRVNQWSRASRRLKELRTWCAELGPGSECR